MRALAILLLLAAPAFGEVRPGFSLYGHVAQAESIVLATVDAKGRASILDLLLRFARSPLACRTPALANLRTWTKKEWEAAADRWDRLLAR